MAELHSYKKMILTIRIMTYQSPSFQVVDGISAISPGKTNKVNKKFTITPKAIGQIYPMISMYPRDAPLLVHNDEFVFSV